MENEWLNVRLFFLVLTISLVFFSLSLHDHLHMSPLWLAWSVVCFRPGGGVRNYCRCVLLFVRMQLYSGDCYGRSTKRHVALLNTV